MLITKQYTPPTCTLKISANTSFFSRWKHKNWHNLQFKLAFDDPRLSEDKYISIQGDRHHLSSLYETLSNYINEFLNASPLSEVVTTTETPENNDNVLTKCSDFHLKPDGLLYHDLFLGTLAPSASESSVHLSALQLFDVTTALSNCITEIEPFLASETKKKPTSPAWLRTIMIIITTTGLFTGIINLSNYYRRDRFLISTQETAPESAPIPLPEIIPPPPPEFPTTEPPEPPQIEVTVAPDLPIVDTVPLTVPAPIFADPPDSPVLMPNVVQGTDGMFVIPTEPINRTPANPLENPPPQTPIAPPPNPPFDIGMVPENINLPTLENTKTPDTDIAANDSSQNTPDKPENPEPIAQLNKRPTTIASTHSRDITLFDEIPQVTEVRNYFLENWYPPKNINKILQYRLQINSNGSIDSISPIGEASVNWLKQINLPSVNQPFVSEMEDGSNPKIRVVLEPNGRVQAFLESSN